MSVTGSFHMSYVNNLSEVVAAFSATGNDSTDTYESECSSTSLSGVTTETIYDDSTSRIGTLAYLFLRASDDVTVEFKGSAADELVGFVVKAEFPLIISGQMLPEGIAGGAEAIKVVKVRNLTGSPVTVVTMILGT